MFLEHKNKLKESKFFHCREDYFVGVRFLHFRAMLQFISIVRENPEFFGLCG